MNRFWRGWILPLATFPLLPAAIFNLFAGREVALLGCLLGIAAAIFASVLLRRGHHGDAGRAALVMGGGVAAVTAMAADAGPVAALLLAAGAWGGTRMLYSGMAEVAPPAPPPPAPVTQKPPEPDPLADARARLARITAHARALPEPRLLPVADAIGGVLDDLQRRPERLAQARRFLAVHLDGLERIAARLEAGARPPASLGPLLGELEAAARDLRGRLREEESAALAVQVKVLGDRLREEGFG